MLIALLLACGLMAAATSAEAAYLLAPGLTQQSAVPADFANSMELSIAAKVGDIAASRGFNLTTVPFDGAVNQSVTLPFTSNHQLLSEMQFDSAGILYLGVSASSSPGSLWRRTADAIQHFVDLPSNRRSVRALDFGIDGDIYVAGAEDPINGPGWLLRYAADGTLLKNSQTVDGIVGLASNRSGAVFAATFSGKIFEVSSDLELIDVAQLPDTLVGTGIGYVESFTIDSAGDLFVGLNLGQRFGANSGAIVRLNSSSQLNVIAFGVGSLPVDIAFGPDNLLYVASFDPLMNEIVRIQGDFSGDDLGMIPSPLPEPAFLAAALLGLGLLVRRRR